MHPSKAVKKIHPHLLLIVLAMMLAMFFLFFIDRWPLCQTLNLKAYRALLNIDYSLRGPPQQIHDLVLVGIDNDTVYHMRHRWPYPRKDFSRVLAAIEKAGPRAIAVDFAYLGDSTPTDDAALQKALDDPRIILPAAINDYGYLNTDYAANLKTTATYGIVTKLQDPDGIIRKNLVYLVGQTSPGAFLSWEMQILKTVKGLDPGSLVDEGSRIRFHGLHGEQWTVPVDPTTKSFLIHFRSHTKDFREISFYKVLSSHFDADLIKNKIVFLGVIPAVYQDIQNTAFGWLPGVVLNANAFLTLYTHDFLKPLPQWPQDIVALVLVALTAWFLALHQAPKTIGLIILEIIIFGVFSYGCLRWGYVLNDLAFPGALLLGTWGAHKIFKVIRKLLEKL